MSWLYWVYPRKAEVRAGEVSQSAIHLCLPLWNTWMSNMLGNSWTALTTCWSVLSTVVPAENLALTPCCLPEEIQAPTMLCRPFILRPCPLLQACFLWFFDAMCTQWTSHTELLDFSNLRRAWSWVSTLLHMLVDETFVVQGIPKSPPCYPPSLSDRRDNCVPICGRQALSRSDLLS